MIFIIEKYGTLLVINYVIWVLANYDIYNRKYGALLVTNYVIWVLANYVNEVLVNYVIWSKLCVTSIFKAKPNTHNMCAQKLSLHTYRTENGYKIINVTIYSIYYWIMHLQKIKSNTLRNITAERVHNSTGNRPSVIARIEYHIEILQIIFSF
jgi:hypothetical protein